MCEVGIGGNERADKLTKRGAMNQNQPIQVGLSQKVIRSKIKDWLINKSSHIFRKTLGTRHSKIVINEFSESRTKKLLKLQRNELREVTAFYTGHGKFRRHLQNMRLAEDSKCKFCDDDETAEHVMCKCHN